ncbi:MAG: hypothetical protein ACI4LA_06395 [Emergencia sp.]
MDPLGMLVIMFAGMSLISAAGILLMFLLKDEKKQKGVFYFMAVWSMAIAWLNADSQPENFIGSQAAAWGIGAVGAAALLLQLCSRGKNTFLAARILAALSTACGLVFMFIL